jgi:hypothetical protein
MVTRAKGCLLASAILASVLAAPAGASERVYKWVDKDGVVHFGQQPPIATPAEAIQVQKGFSMPAEDDAPAPTPAEQSAVQQEEYCAAATKNFETLSGDGEVSTKDEKGESRLMTADERKAELERMKKAMDLYCKPKAPEPPRDTGAQ